MKYFSILSWQSNRLSSLDSYITVQAFFFLLRYLTQLALVSYIHQQGWAKHYLGAGFKPCDPSYILMLLLAPSDPAAGENATLPWEQEMGSQVDNESLFASLFFSPQGSTLTVEASFLFSAVSLYSVIWKSAQPLPVLPAPTVQQLYRQLPLKASSCGVFDEK